MAARLCYGRVLEPDKALAIIDDVGASLRRRCLRRPTASPRTGSRQRSDTSRWRLAQAASGRSPSAAGTPSKGMNTLTRWPPVSLTPGSRHVVYRDPLSETRRGDAETIPRRPQPGRKSAVSRSRTDAAGKSRAVAEPHRPYPPRPTLRQCSTSWEH